jgi:hypothetical protein
LSYVDDKKFFGTLHPLDRGPGALEVKNKGKRGIGAWLYKRFSDTKTTGPAGERIQTVTHTLTIEVTRNEFGAAFAKAYGTRELRETAINEFKLTAMSYVLGKISPYEGTEAIRVVLGAMRRFSEPVTLLAQGFAAFKTVYDSFRYEVGCKIEEKVIIKTTTFKRHGDGSSV